MTQPLEVLRAQLVGHPLYREVRDLGALRVFMESHVFAVWDFMSLVTRLRIELTGTRLPWTPPRDPVLARFLNEIVLDEETDLGPDGAPCSHFGMYLEAMDEVGADTGPIRSFVDHVANDYVGALQTISSPAVRRFVTGTIDIATTGSPLEVAAAFLFGREDVIPDMFSRVRESWPDAQSAGWFCHYLERHIELDGGEHGDLAHRMLSVLRADATPEQRERADRVACDAVRSRIELWDDVRRRIHSPTSKTSISSWESTSASTSS